jgi:hypothetical protein
MRNNSDQEKHIPKKNKQKKSSPNNLVQTKSMEYLLANLHFSQQLIP